MSRIYSGGLWTYIVIVDATNAIDTIHAAECPIAEVMEGHEAGLLDNVNLATAVADWRAGVIRDGFTPNAFAYCLCTAPHGASDLLARPSSTS